jgi:Peptidase family M23
MSHCRRVKRLARSALGVALAIAACTEQLVVRPEGEFSWEPQAELIWPVEGTVVSGYGDSSRPSHRGIDLAAHPGDPVAAALEGEASFVGEIAGYGKVVALTHGARLTTLYAHLGETRVNQGERVLRGQTIGTIGPEGYLHYEIRESKEPVDPAKLYATAPNPAAGGAVDVRERLAGEPPSLGTLGAAGVPQPPPTPLPTEAPRIPARHAKRPPPTRIPTPLPTPMPPRPTIAPPPRPTPAAPRPTLAPPRARRTEAAESAPQAPGELAPSGESSRWSGLGVGVAVVASNLLYVPAKLAYATAGAVTGTFVLLFAHDKSVADRVWTPTLGGDYFVTAAHLRGERPIQFVGSETENQPPPVRRPPVRRRHGSSSGASRPQ